MANQSVTTSLQTLGPCLTYYPKLANILGLKESILLCQLIYWTSRTEDPDRWVFKSAKEFEIETGLGYKEQRRAREVLRGRGLVEEKASREEHRLYFRIVPEAIDSAFEHMPKGKVLKKRRMVPNGNEHLPDEHMPKRQEAPAQREDGTCPKGSSYIEAEITAETTQRLHSSSQGKPAKSSAQDQRFTPFRKRFEAYYAKANVDPQTHEPIPAPWDAREAGSLARWLRANPTITEEQWHRALLNRYRSPVTHTDRLSRFIENMPSWMKGLAGDFGREIKTGGFNGRHTDSLNSIAEHRARHANDDESDTGLGLGNLFVPSREADGPDGPPLLERSIGSHNGAGKSPERDSHQANRVLAIAGKTS